jgi:hypothetical protein
VKEGRDPLRDAALVARILELSRRASYLSFHAYLLDLCRKLRLSADGSSLSTFTKGRERSSRFTTTLPQCFEVTVIVDSHANQNHDD